MNSMRIQSSTRTSRETGADYMLAMRNWTSLVQEYGLTIVAQLVQAVGDESLGSTHDGVLVNTTPEMIPGVPTHLRGDCQAIVEGKGSWEGGEDGGELARHEGYEDAAGLNGPGQRRGTGFKTRGEWQRSGALPRRK